MQLVNEITYNALTLVQDPYGNYVSFLHFASWKCVFTDPEQVVQYILDLNDNRFSDGVIRQFTGNVCALSVQKFSSNVIEKVYRMELDPFCWFMSHACPLVRPRGRARHP